MNNETKEIFTNDAQATSIGEEEIVLASPTELFEEAKTIAQNTGADEKFPFTLQYDVNQKDFLLSMLQTVGAIVEEDDEEGHLLATRMNMTQLAFIKRLDCIERVKSNEGSNPFLAEEDEKLASVQEQSAESVQTAQVMTLSADETVDSSAAYGVAVASACGSPTNGSMETAQTIFVDGLEVSGNICCPDAQQWFKFTTSEAGDHTIYTTGNLDTVGCLYDETGALLAQVDDYDPRGKLNFRIIIGLPANKTFYVKVTANNSVTGRYKVRVTKKTLVELVSVTPSTIVLQCGTTYELPITPNYTSRNIGALPIEGLSVALSPADANEQKVIWYETDRSLMTTKMGGTDAGERYQTITTIEKTGTAKLYIDDWFANGSRAECTVTVVTPYEKQLLDSCGFSSEEVDLILKLYDRVDAVFSSESTMLKAWKCARLLSEFCYDYLTYGINTWDDVAGSVTKEANRKTYFTDTLGYTESEYNKLDAALCRNYDDASEHHKLIDFPHMQYALAARLAYTLKKDKDLSNIFSGLYTGNYGIYTDEEVSYLAGWLGDAVLTSLGGVGTPVLKNDDYMADLDAENIYRLILQGDSAVSASNTYYSNMTASNTRADIFLQHIPYATVKEKIFRELLDSNLINNEQVCFDTIKTNYPDTYDFLKSLEDRLSTMAHYE